LADERASELWASFSDQWLGTNGVSILERNPEKYPLFSEETRDALSEQTGRFFDYVARSLDGRLETLLTSRSVPLKGPLFALHGLAAPSQNTDWVVAELPADQRAGVLTFAPFMAVNSHAEQTSLVRRGYMIRTRLMCQIPPPPPPDVDADVPAVDPALTARERFALHRANPTCASCHTLMDPLGLPFEIYDAIGEFRTHEGEKPIDASGALTGTTNHNGDVTGPLELVTRLAAADEVANCVVRQLFRYAFNRVEAPDDAAQIEALTATFNASERRLPALLQTIAESNAFRAGPIR
jgi:hypothetical protein